MDLNKIYCGNFVDISLQIDDNLIDLIVTSPPYDNLRTYNGYVFDFEKIAYELHRILKPGGVIVWVVGDSIINGSETCTSFKQAIYFTKIGLNLHDTMIYEKSGFANPSSNRYHQTFEYMFVLSKGKPKTFNPIKDRENKYTGICGGEKSFRDKFGMRFNVWRYPNGGNNTSKDKLTFEHPAPFPEKLAEDHILSWSNTNDIIMDPMCGSGTTLKMAKKNGRSYIGVDISSEYCELSKNRLKIQSKE